MIGRDADIDVCAQRKLRGAAKTKWQFRARDQRMIGKELVQDPVRESQAVKIVLTAQDEIMELGQRIDQTRFGIEASEIKTIVAIVVKKLLPHVDEAVERPRDARRHALRKRKKTGRKSARPKNGIEISEHRKLEACVPFFLKPHISFVKPLIRRREARRLRMICAQAQGRNPKVASRFRMSALILFLILPPFLPNFPSHNWIMLKIRDKRR